MKSKFFSITGLSVWVAGLVSVLTLAGCGGGSSASSSGGGTGDDTTTSIASLGTSVTNVRLLAGVPSQTRFTFAVPGDILARGDYFLNVSETLQNVTLSTGPIARTSSRFEVLKLLAHAFVKSAIAEDPKTAEIIAYLSFAGDPNVCSSANKFGPYSITGMIGSALTSETTLITPTQPVVDIVNAGDFEICVTTTPPIDAYVTVSDIAVDFQQCNDSSLDIVGTWNGTYECTNFGTDDDPLQPINLTITRNTDGSYRYVDDGGAVYNGHLCGNKFKHSGGLAGSYTESGTLVFSDSASATKTSTWSSVPAGMSGGNCADTLEKQS